MYDLVVICMLGLPSRPVTSVTPLSNTSFTINWTSSDPDYNYTVKWTNLNTSAVDNNSVSENSYTVTGLNDTNNYNVSIIATGECGIMTSDPITVYGKTCTYMYIFCYIKAVRRCTTNGAETDSISNQFLALLLYVAFTHIHM